MRPIYAHSLQDTYTIYKHTLRAYNLRVQPPRTIYAPVLRVQSTRPTYVIRHVIRLSLARTCYATVLHVQSIRPTYAIRHVIRLSLACMYFTS